VFDGWSAGTESGKTHGMALSTQLGQVKEVTLPQGTIRYRERGTGRPLVFVHGLLVNGDLWRKVVPEIASGYRCIVPDLPLGSHEIAMPPNADLSIPALARLIADFLAALDLRDVVLIANDTGGALAQVTVTEYPERIGGLVLTSCDAYDNFLPPFFRPLQWLAHVPPLLHLMLQPSRLRPLRRLPVAFGWLSKRPVEATYSDGYVRPFFADAGVRRDCVKVLRAIDPVYTLRAAEKLQRFDRPVLLAWAAEDRFFPVEHAHRLAAACPRATVELIHDSYTFISEDQPHELARVLRRFLEGAGAGNAATGTGSSLH
jgi:pimeloyl-ACP methyl ester carboxylesterase